VVGEDDIVSLSTNHRRDFRLAALSDKKQLIAWKIFEDLLESRRPAKL